jgi:hypothetical protein
VYRALDGRGKIDDLASRTPANVASASNYRHAAMLQLVTEKPAPKVQIELAHQICRKRPGADLDWKWAVNTCSPEFRGWLYLTVSKVMDALSFRFYTSPELDRCRPRLVRSSFQPNTLGAQKASG